MEREKLPPLALAQKAGQELNVVMRLVKYGYAPVEAIPSIAEALGHLDPNDLLPEDGEQSTGCVLKPVSHS